MPTVLSYWCLPDEENELLDYLKKWNIYAYPTQALPNLYDIKPRPLAKILEDHPRQLDFGPEEFLSPADVGKWRGTWAGTNEETQLYGIELYAMCSMRSHTVGYRRPFYYSNGALGKSNLTAYWKYPNVEFTDFIEKNPEFTKWVKTMFCWVRKWTSEKVVLNGHIYPATNKVKRLVDENKLAVWR